MLCVETRFNGNAVAMYAKNIKSASEKLKI